MKLNEHLQLTVQQYYADKKYLCIDHDCRFGSIYGRDSNTTTSEGEECYTLNGKDEEKTQALNGGQTKEDQCYENKLKEDTVSKIVELILSQKPKLYLYFTKMNSERQGNNTRV